MRRRVAVAVVGGGAIGLAAALQLCRAGITDVVVVERHPAPGMGSTGKANGGVRAQFSTPIHVTFSQYTIQRLIDLDAATRGQVGFRPIGYLFMTATDVGMEALRRSFDMQASLGVPVRWLTPNEIRDVAPFLRLDGLQAATFCAADGIVDPHGVVSAYSEEGRRLGATYLFDTQVAAIEPTARGAVVRCNGVDLDSEWVINAAGAFARDVASMCGIELPVTSYRRNLACTEPVPAIPATMPMCVDVDTGVLIRGEAGGVLIGYSDPESPPSTETAFEPAFLDAVAQRVGNRFPFLAGVPINPRKCWAGLYPETPDHHAIIDASPDAPWFIQCAGFGGHGIMHSLAAGQAVTELLRDSRCSTFDLHPLRLDRFRDGSSSIETAVL